MENYTKGETRTVHDPAPLFVEGAVEMKVTNGSKIRNIMGFAMSSIADNNVRHITWSGSGNAISKTISCVEIMKRKIKVNTNIPAISILLSKDPLDTNNPSYQAPGAKDVAWAGTTGQNNRSRPPSSKKRRDAVKDVKAAASKPKRNRDKGGPRKPGNKKIKAENSQAKTENGQAKT
ncbi:hypothetical protein EGW08_015529 [Elysia chlorotica]|uniref:DNA/RNA-binding protein Alba-like domain-containing protein n=1 Tax=Elysia chlorotica TaxID=188477 RepID=A0A3S1B785_ELYCH|nr:hypothetical protein EGW08_015529 [Elysia chlorotica]